MEFARLAHIFEELEGTSSRLALIGLLTELFRSIEWPEEIAQVCYLVQGRVAPFYVAVLRLAMVDKSTSPRQTHFGRVLGDKAVQTGLLYSA